MRALEFWCTRAVDVQQLPPLPAPLQKTFIPKFVLPVVLDYQADPGEVFWEAFPSYRSLGGRPLISPTSLLSIGLASGIANVAGLDVVYQDLLSGANIGCSGTAREPTRSGNAPSCWDFSEHITDAVAGWIQKKFVAGPFLEAELPVSAKVNGIMCRPKPNGSVRVILNLSAPLGVSVNDGIDASEFPTVMSSTGKWLEVLDRAGPGCLMTKVDWSDAYKHLHAPPQDLDLQWFQCLGRYFVELCLVFGAASSPGIYDRAAKIVLDIVLKLSGFPRNMVCQYLDDVCAAAPAGSSALDSFRACYFAVAEQVGVRLAPEDDPEKAFAPCTVGTVLGVTYDTLAWTWRIPVDKLHRLIVQIDHALVASVLSQQDVWSLVGRIIHYCPLVPCGRFNIHHLIRINSISKNKRHWVPIDALVKRQLSFWKLMLRVSSGFTAIPRPVGRVPAWAMEFFTDAAGGSTASVGLGCGGVSGEWWFFVPWGRKINCGVKWDSKKLSQKMSALELVGPLICLASRPDVVRNSAVRIFVDNSGSVRIWEKGYSNRCSLCTSLVSAIGTVAAALGCQVAIDKVARCSSPGSLLADALSKAAFVKFHDIASVNAWPLAVEPGWVPPSILRWIASPSNVGDLGEDVLLDIWLRHHVLGYA